MGRCNRIEGMRRVHTQKHMGWTKILGENNQQSKIPWFCKAFQNGSCHYSKDNIMDVKFLLILGHAFEIE